MKKLFSFLAGLVVAVGVFSAIGNPLQAAGDVIGSVDGYVEKTPFRQANLRYIVAGWAKDRVSTGQSLTVRVVSPQISWGVIDSFKADLARTDVRNAFGGTTYSGFNWEIPANFYNGDTYNFTFQALSADGSHWSDIGSLNITMPDLGLRGDVDYIGGKEIRGWAIDLDGDMPHQQPTAVMVQIDGVTVDMALTGEYRPDVDDYFDGQGYLYTYAGDNTGFTFKSLNIPDRFRDGQGHRVVVFALEYTEGHIEQIGQQFDVIITSDGEMVR